MRIASLLLVALTLTGCALSPQTINVTPTLHIQNEALGHAQTIDVQVTDERADRAIGSRGGVYAKSSIISAGNDVVAAVRAEMEKGLVAQDYAIYNGTTGSAAAIGLKVAIVQLSYVVPEGSVTTGADITVILRITAERAGASHTTIYRSAINHKFPVAPTASQNERWVNEMLSETIERFFTDPQMRSFLGG